MIVRVRMAHPMWTHPLHDTTIVTPVLWEGAHRVVGAIMNGAWLTKTPHGIMCVDQLLLAVL